MRGLRGRRARSLAIAGALGLLLLAVSTAVVAVVLHRPPPVVAVGSHPRPPAATAVALTGQSTTPVIDPSVAAAVTPAPPRTAAPSAHRPPATVPVDETTGSVTVPVGTLLEVRLHGTPTDRWHEPDTGSPGIVERLSGSATPDGNATASFRAVAVGEAVIIVERATTCSSGPTGGVCAVEARRIGVTVNG